MIGGVMKLCVAYGLFLGCNKLILHLYNKKKLSENTSIFLLITSYNSLNIYYGYLLKSWKFGALSILISNILFLNPTKNISDKIKLKYIDYFYSDDKIIKILDEYVIGRYKYNFKHNYLYYIKEMNVKNKYFKYIKKTVTAVKQKNLHFYKKYMKKYPEIKNYIIYSMISKYHIKYAKKYHLNYLTFDNISDRYFYLNKIYKMKYYKKIWNKLYGNHYISREKYIFYILSCNK